MLYVISLTENQNELIESIVWSLCPKKLSSDMHRLTKRIQHLMLCPNLLKMQMKGTIHLSNSNN